MEHSQEKITKVKAEFSRRKRTQLILTAPLILIALMIGFSSAGSPLLGIPLEIWIVLFIGLLVPAYMNWRCPNCNYFLGRGSGFSPKFCRNCGIPLAGD